MRTPFTDLVGVVHPLAGFNRSPAVVVAVSRAGALGVLGATMYTPEQLDAQLTWIEDELGGRPYGVDLLVPTPTLTGERVQPLDGDPPKVPPAHRAFVEDVLDRFGIPPLGDDVVLDRTGRIDLSLETNTDAATVNELLEVVFAHRSALVASALGTPPPEMIDLARRAGVPIAALVGTAEHARRQLAAGVDLLVAQGTEGGGHTGNVATMVLTPEVVELAGSVPVLAAGGIATGRQMAAALALGAAGAWTGSVWLSSFEDPASPVIKDKLISARSTDTTISRTRTGKPARQLRSAWLDEWGRPGAPSPLPMPWQSVLVREAWERIDVAAQAGDERARDLESFFVGQVVGTFAGLRPAGEIVHDIVSECENRLNELARLARPGGP
ncbi:nitronate monooxygenase [Georgenia yuyongxinii]|uniref:Nitronate monooxygenase n=1 Tax=Georgenia yuyongxinii TaxID=2589797 RepID=A0A5B8C3Z2_9MICO|nr:nitronate monooxygenase [Georgenia yuyongxinii]QDC25008.1 nitronate monooxygenase [Georgenia yuyongxinii]